MTEVYVLIGQGCEGDMEILAVSELPDTLETKIENLKMDVKYLFYTYEIRVVDLI